MRKASWLFALLFTAGMNAAALAEVKPHALFSDNMVLQRGMTAPVWGTADADEQVTVSVQGQEVSTKANGSGDWIVRLQPLKAGGPIEMTIKGTNTITLKNVLIGEVWICSGQSNMEWPLRLTENKEQAIADSTNDNVRLFTVPHKISAEPQKSVKSQWVECNPQNVPNFSAVGYYFGRDLQKALNVPVGLINTSWGGTAAEVWASRVSLESNPSLKYIPENFDKARAEFMADPTGKARDPLKGHPIHAALLYNGMIAPLQPFAIKGAIWYQGESNAGRAFEYRTLFPVMIQSWRDSWQQGDFPFLFVQLAPFMKIEKEPKPSAWAELREAQLLTTQNCKNTGMAVITDVGDEKDIHPQKKAPVGARLALAARAIAYGDNIIYSGPVYETMKKDGDKIVLNFKHTGGGLETRGGSLQGFAIAAADQKFVSAKAKIEGDKVVVWSPDVADPVAVRFGWANYPLGNLWNKEGLPATPFRTDDFPLTTAPKK